MPIVGPLQPTVPVMEAFWDMWMMILGTPEMKYSEMAEWLPLITDIVEPGSREEVTRILTETHKTMYETYPGYQTDLYITLPGIEPIQFPDIQFPDISGWFEGIAEFGKWAVIVIALVIGAVLLIRSH